ncbi:hypothetical protein F5883DRAFT_588262 [Diaporthe sp. PMI_573]|nr:hypothetical protein F5883DRAFT_588262 [Diaporthaceae sp. PMI_573]
MWCVLELALYVSACISSDDDGQACSEVNHHPHGFEVKGAGVLSALDSCVVVMKRVYEMVDAGLSLACIGKTLCSPKTMRTVMRFGQTH